MDTNQTFSGPFLLLAGIACCTALLLFACGCCEAVPAGPPVKTVSPDQPREVTWVEETAAADPCVPQPTDAVPNGYAVETGISKEPITGDITVKVVGGEGLSLLQHMDVSVMRPDGTSSTRGLDQPKVNDEVTLPGTKDGSDRVTIEKTYLNGHTYVTDDLLLGGRELRTGGQGGGGGGGC
ncbi:MAG: hypothetical protein GKC04_03050 [Methanomicrobiales archaeon]|nr:hypothetical protein [Methanomicrobiales archaeon]